MDKELLREVIGRRKWWLINFPLIVVFLVVLAVFEPRWSDGAPVEPETKICPAGEWDCYTAQRFASEFSDGKYGTSRGIEFSPRIKKMIEKAAKSTPDMKGEPSWWEESLGYAACIAGPKWTGVCLKGQKRVDQVMRKTAKIAVACGGIALVGALGGGGHWGAGKGALACLWSRAMGFWD